MSQSNIVFLLFGFLLKFSGRVLSQNTVCNVSSAIDISDGMANGNDIYHNDVIYTPENYFKTNDDTTMGCICNIIKCYYKCCKYNEYMIDGICVLSAKSDDLFADNKLNAFVEKTFGLDKTYIIHKHLPCVPERVRNIVNAPRNDNGSDNYKHIITENLLGYEDDSESFCVDYFENVDKRSGYAGLICYKDVEEKYNYISSTGMIISMPFLIATFLVYALLPDKNLPAKSLMCYVLSLLFAYIMLVTIQLNSNLQEVACSTIAFLCYFFFMASFFWMNSSCIDIWLTFSGIKGITGQRTQERKRFIYYCLYSWGLPLIMTAIVIVMTMNTDPNTKPSHFDTGIGAGQCWFRNGLPTGIYFYFPIAALLIANVTLFAITALKIRNVQRDTKVLTEKDSSKHEKDKQRFNLYVKLLFAMGVNWSMEVISWAVMWQLNQVPAYIWYITDFCNAMYGVLIFFIFVFKKNIWIMLKKRYLQFMGRPTQAHSMGTSTHRTTVSQVTSSEA